MANTVMGGSPFYTSVSPIYRKAWSDREKTTIEPKVTTNGKWTWIYERTPWIKMTSFCAIEKPGGGWDTDARLNWMLFNGQQQKSKTRAGSAETDNRKTFDEIYGGSKFDRPMPGIISLDCETKGGLGSTKEATVKFVCWDDDQLEMMELLYMSLGKSVRVEWGWSVDNYGNEVLPIWAGLNDNQGNIITDAVAITNINANKLKYNGCYDGFQGLVTNFSWNKRTDGGYDCESKIICAGDMWLSSPIKTRLKKIKKDNTIQTKTTTDTAGTDDSYNPNGIEIDIMGMWQYAYKQSNIGRYIYANAEEINVTQDEIDFINATSSDPLAALSRIRELLFLRNANSKEEPIGLSVSNMNYDMPTDNQSWWQRNVSSMFGSVTCSDPVGYVTFGAILKYMINGNLSYRAKGIYSNNMQKTPGQQNDAYVKFNDTDPIYAPYRRGLCSTDPLRVILPGWEHSYKIGNIGGLIGVGQPGSDLNLINNKAYKYFAENFWIVNGFNSYQDIINAQQNFTQTGQATAIGEVRVDIRYILIGLDFLKSAIAESETIDDLVLSILKSISECTGNVWDFSLDVNESSPNLVRIVEANSLSETEPGPLVINASTTDKEGCSIIGFNFETDISSDVANMVMYGSNQNAATKGDMTGDGVGSIGYRMFGRRTKSLSIGPEGLVPPDYNDKIDGEKVDSLQDPQTLLEEALKRLYERQSDENATAAANALSNFFTEEERSIANPSGSSVPPRPLINIKFTCQIDGFSGLKPGNLIDPTFLPERYKTSSDYMVMGIKHSVDNSKWVTDVQTIMRPTFPELKAGANNTSNIPTSGSLTSTTDFSAIPTSTIKYGNTANYKTLLTGTRVENNTTTQIEVYVTDDPDINGLFKNPVMGIVGQGIAANRGNIGQINQNGRHHLGIDISGNSGKEVRATFNGFVVSVQDVTDINSDAHFGGYGCNVVLKHIVRGKTYFSYYHHLQKMSTKVKSGQSVVAGQILGRVGTTGDSTGEHLHFEIRGSMGNFSRTSEIYDPRIVIPDLGRGANNPVASGTSSPIYQLLTATMLNKTKTLTDIKVKNNQTISLPGISNIKITITSDTTWTSSYNNIPITGTCRKL